MDLGVKSVRLLTNNPEKITMLERSGIPVSKRVGMDPVVTPDNLKYLETKINRMNHLIDLNPGQISQIFHENGAD
jgi:GTP cyclohydrolase II